MVTNYSEGLHRRLPIATFFSCETDCCVQHQPSPLTFICILLLNEKKLHETWLWSLSDCVRLSVGMKRSLINHLFCICISGFVLIYPLAPNIYYIPVYTCMGCTRCFTNTCYTKLVSVGCLSSDISLVVSRWPQITKCLKVGYLQVNWSLLWLPCPPSWYCSSRKLFLSMVRGRCLKLVPDPHDLSLQACNQLIFLGDKLIVTCCT